ncbi:MAG: MMPL family transporter, partial [Acidimicrobiales bacterium]
IEVIPSTSPQDQDTVDLVKFLRSDVIPQSVEGTLSTVHVTGSVAASIDFTALLASRLLVFIAAVLTLSFLLLIVMFRSLLVPLKAVAM